MRKTSYLTVCIMRRIVVLTVIACLCFNVSYAQMRDFVGSNGRIIEATFLGFDEATQIVNIRLRDGREQNVRLDLFSAACQQWIRAGGQQQGDDPFGDAGAPLLEQKGDFEWLFDGRSLNGWEGDTNAWRVDQNEKTLVSTGRGNLFTRKEYDNFIIQLEFRVDDRANNGLLLRMGDNAMRNVSQAMRIQIADDRHTSGRNHNGSIVETLSGPKPHSGAGNWNFLEVIADGQKITTYVNGMKVVDDTLPQGRPFSNVRSGRIGLMGVGGTTAFRHIRIKPLKAGEDWRTSRITANDSGEGFQRIFDGRTLNGWRGEQNKFRAENNVLTIFDVPGKLETVKEYRNFALRFEYRLSRGSVSAVSVRKNSDSPGFPIFIKDDSGFRDDRGGFHFNGSVDLGHPARRGGLNAVGQWNTAEIIVNGSMIRVVVNDKIVLDTDFGNMVVLNANVTPWSPTTLASSGSIEFIGKVGQIDFRNIRVKELP